MQKRRVQKPIIYMMIGNHAYRPIVCSFVRTPLEKYKFWYMVSRMTLFKLKKRARETDSSREISSSFDKKKTQLNLNIMKGCPLFPGVRLWELRVAHRHLGSLIFTGFEQYHHTSGSCVVLRMLRLRRCHQQTMYLPMSYATSQGNFLLSPLFIISSFCYTPSVPNYKSF